MKGATGKIISEGGGLLNFRCPLMKVGLPLMKNVLTPLVKIILIPLGLTTAASATNSNADIQTKIYGSGMTILIISNEGMKDIEIVTSLEECGLLIKGIRGTLENEAKLQKSGFLSISLGKLAAKTIGNLLASKPKIPRGGIITAGEGTIRAAQDF